MTQQRTYIAIDLKSFYASVECVEMTDAEVSAAKCAFGDWQMRICGLRDAVTATD